LVISILRAALAAASSAEAATEAATARVHAVDAQIHAVIALDPTALDQARAIDRGRRARGLLYGYAIDRGQHGAAGERDPS
jgi:amidase